MTVLRRFLRYVSEQALALGALDVMLAPVQMKKGSPGTLLTLLCTPGTETTFADLLFRETSTLGVRTRRESRMLLAREIVSVDTSFGPIRVKRATTNARADAESCAGVRGLPSRS